MWARHWATWAVTALAVAGIGLVGCGGEETPSTQFSIVGGEIKGDSELAGYAFEGADVVSPGPTIRVRAGRPLTITFKNVHGQYFGETYIPHNLVVTATKDEDAQPLWDAAIPAGPDTLNVGESESVTFAPDRAGSYFYVCTVYSHIDRGMWGRFIVEQ